LESRCRSPAEETSNVSQHLAAIGVAAGLVVAGLVFAASRAPVSTPPVSGTALYGFHVRTMADSEQSLADYRGRALLIVNTASRCGFTPQYRSLEALYQKYRSRGFEVLAFPANNFLGQEPGTNAEIRQFCSANYHTSFPLFAKISVKGRDIEPLYAWLTRASGFPGDIPWNFTKFLVAPDGRVVARFGPNTDPLDASVVEKLEAVLPPAR
jgi:glutathione peroxidase